MDPRNPSKPGDTTLTPSEYVASIKSLLRSRKMRDAYALIQHAVVLYGNDPFLLSYFGYLQARVEGKYRHGIDACTRAVALYEKMTLAGEEATDEKNTAYLYLNLSKAYTAAGKRKNAIDALNSGLKHDRHNREVKAELERLGIRRLIPIPFLNRSNFLNELIGKMMRKKKTEDETV